MERTGQHHTPAALPQGKTPVTIKQEAGWTPGPVWTGAENLASTGIRSPDRPARSESLYRLRYPGTHIPTVANVILRNVETCSGAHPASYKMGGKVDGAWRWSPTPT